MTFSADYFNRTTGNRLNVGLSSDLWSEPDTGNYFLIDANRAKVPVGNPGGSGYASMPVADGAMDISAVISQEGSGYWFFDIHRPDASTPGRFFRIQRSGAGVLYICDENGGSETFLATITGVGAGPNTWRFLTTPGATTFLQVFRDGVSMGTWSIAADLSTGHHWFSMLGETGTVFDEVINDIASTTSGRLARESVAVAIDTPVPQALLARQSTEVAINTVTPDVRLARHSVQVALKASALQDRGWGVPL